MFGGRSARGGGLAAGLLLATAIFLLGVGDAAASPIAEITAGRKPMGARTRPFAAGHMGLEPDWQTGAETQGNVVRVA